MREAGQEAGLTPLRGKTKKRAISHRTIFHRASGGERAGQRRERERERERKAERRQNREKNAIVIYNVLRKWHGKKEPGMLDFKSCRNPLQRGFITVYETYLTPALSI